MRTFLCTVFNFMHLLLPNMIISAVGLTSDINL